MAEKITKLFAVILAVAVYLFGAYFVFAPWIRAAKQTKESDAAVEAFLERRTQSILVEQTQQTEPVEAPEPTQTPTEAELPTEEVLPEETPEELPYAQLRQAMEEYNAQIFAERQAGLKKVEDYERGQINLSAYGIEDKMVGVIEIPAMDVVLPIYLGANYANLDQGAACMGQTSLPIGGENTNCVIAGHRGWHNNNYFKAIEKLEAGDEVIITNLWEVLRYRVCEIRIVAPRDIQQVLIQEGRDLITLHTCHPFGSGGRYRYLVYCERVIEEDTPILPQETQEAQMSAPEVPETSEKEIEPIVCVQGLEFESSQREVWIYDAIPWVGIGLTALVIGVVFVYIVRLFGRKHHK